MTKKPAAAAAVTLILLACAAFASPAQAKKTSSRKPAKVAKAQNNYVSQGLNNLERGEYTAAVNNFKKAVKSKGEASSYFLLGYAYYQRGFSAGSPELADKQDAQETINAYNTSIAIDPSLSNISQPYKLYHGLALSYEALGDPEKAVDAYRKAFQAAPDNVMLPLYAARLRYKMNDMEKSTSNFELALKKAKATGQDAALIKVIRTNPLFAVMLASPAHLEIVRRYDYTPVNAPADTAIAARDAVKGDAFGLRDSVRGTTPAENKPAIREQDQAVFNQLSAANDEFRFRRYRDAVDAYGNVLTLNQNSGTLAPSQMAFVYERIGTSYNKLGQSSESVSYLRKAVQQQPFDTAAHYQLALAYSVTGRYQESMRALIEAFKTAPSTGELKRYMLLAKTDTELDPVRDLPAFESILSKYRERLQTTR